MKTGRPSGFVATGKMADPLDVSALREAGLLPNTSQLLALGNLSAAPPGSGLTLGGSSQGSLANNLILRRQRELYFGNLPQGQLTAE